MFLGSLILIQNLVHYLFSKKSKLNRNDNDEARARAYLEEDDRVSSEKCYNLNIAEWNYNTNINNVNEALKLNASFEYSQYTKDSWKNFTSQFSSWPNYKDADLKRRIKKFIVLGSSALSDDDLIKVLICYAFSPTITHLLIELILNS